MLGVGLTRDEEAVLVTRLDYYERESKRKQGFPPMLQYGRRVVVRQFEFPAMVHHIGRYMGAGLYQLRCGLQLC